MTIRERKVFKANEFQFRVSLNGDIKDEEDFEQVKGEVLRWVSLLEAGELEESKVMELTYNKEDDDGRTET